MTRSLEVKEKDLSLLRKNRASVAALHKDAQQAVTDRLEVLKAEQEVYQEKIKALKRVAHDIERESEFKLKAFLNKRSPFIAKVNELCRPAKPELEEPLPQVLLDRSVTF
jgi:hypothetical protein